MSEVSRAEREREGKDGTGWRVSVTTMRAAGEGALRRSPEGVSASPVQRIPTGVCAPAEHEARWGFVFWSLGYKSRIISHTYPALSCVKKEGLVKLRESCLLELMEKTALVLVGC